MGSQEQSQKQVESGAIDTDQHFWGAFSNIETEISARWIVRFCQERGCWSPFSYEEIEAFYSRHGYTQFHFNQLVSKDQKYIQFDGEKYSVTLEFVAHCYKASPLS